MTSVPPPSEHSLTEPTPVEPTPTEPPAWLGPVIRWFGLAVAIWGAVLLAWFGAFLTPLRWDTILIPVSVILAIAGNVLLVRFTHDVTGHALLSLLPGLVWLILTLVMSDRTTEGDLVLAQNNWVATVYLFAGSISIGFAFYRLINPRRRPAPPQ